MRELPAGTVTFLFTDVEGSTKLLDEFGAQGYAEALAEHRRVLRETFERHRGVEVDTQGDAFFVAFTTAPEALEAAREAQAALSVPVRMGIHTGTPLLTEDGYVGPDVHRAARIAAAGHGGQVLVSSSSAALLDASNELLRDLGEHRLKDLSAPERIYQLGKGAFPPLRTLYQTNLPVPATPFLGRERELGEIGQLLARDDLRLLTLTGPGGIGKTRLALQAAGAAADRYPDGVFWIPLAPLRDPALVLESASQAAGATDGLAEHAADKRLLLLLDNFEHLIAAADELAALTLSCPNLNLLVTSRELLRIPGEQAYPVPPLEPSEGTALFVTRARATDPDFSPTPAVSELCARLDNLPLALELAAARARVLTPEQLLERLSSRLDLLKAGRGVDPRQQTLRATIAWSYDLLDDAEQQLFARLSVFRGGCTLEAAEEVCETDIDTLQSLVDKSLVRHSGERFWMLETIREFAEELLVESNEQENLGRRHANYFLGLADAANLAVEAITRGPQRHELVLPEQHNVRSAIDWATEHDVELGLHLAISLENFWVTQDPSEGMRRFQALLERSNGVEPSLRARAWRDYGGCSYIAGDLDTAEHATLESKNLFRQAGDERGVVEATFRLGPVAAARGDIPRARELFEETLQSFESLGDEIGLLQVLGDLGALELEQGNRERGWELCQRSLEVARKVGWVWYEAYLLAALGEAAFEAGRADEAERRLRESLAAARRIGDRRRTVFVLASLARIAADRGDAERATTLWAAIEAEHAKAPVGRWAQIRDHYAAHIPPEPQPIRTLELDEAVEYALGRPS